MKTIALLVTLLTGSVLLFHFLFFWMNFSVDSYYYWAIGNYFKTGTYKYDIAFMPTFAKPPTVSPPAFGLLLTTLEFLPYPDIILHLLHLLLLSGTGFSIYKSLRYFIRSPNAAVLACVMVLVPGNLVYASLTLTEVGAEFFVALYAYYLVRFYKTKNTRPL